MLRVSGLRIEFVELVQLERLGGGFDHNHRQRCSFRVDRLPAPTRRDPAQPTPRWRTSRRRCPRRRSSRRRPRWALLRRRRRRLALCQPKVQSCLPGVRRSSLPWRRPFPVLAHADSELRDLRAQARLSADAQPELLGQGVRVPGERSQQPQVPERKSLLPEHPGPSAAGRRRLGRRRGVDGHTAIQLYGELTDRAVGSPSGEVRLAAVGQRPVLQTAPAADRS
jgi:hypothetical protein